jgi:hypothetical protein
VERFVAGVHTHLFAHGDDVRAGAYAAILHVLREAAGNPLIKAILTSERGADPLLPFLTTRADVVLVAATAVVQEWARAHAPGMDADALEFGAESIVRLVVSHIVLPIAPVEHTAERLADFATLLVSTYSAPPTQRGPTA